MNTQIITGSIDELDFSNLKIGNQFIRISNDGIQCDNHESIILQNIHNNCLYSFRDIKLKSNINKEMFSEILNQYYLLINNTPVFINESDTENNFTDINLFNIIQQIDFNVIKSKDFDNIEINKNTKLIFCKIPINDSKLVISLVILNDSLFIKREIYFALENSNNKFITFQVNDPIKFINDVTYLISSFEFEKFKEVINISNYSIDNFINGESNKEFIELMRSDKYFKPKFEFNNFKIYLDYNYNNKNLICCYNDKRVDFYSKEYKRIYEALNNYYFVDSDFNPFVGLTLNGTEVYRDAEGLIYYNSENYYYNYIYKVIINNIYVQADKNEINDLKDRMNVVNKLSDNHNDSDYEF